MKTNEEDVGKEGRRRKDGKRKEEAGRDWEGTGGERRILASRKR